MGFLKQTMASIGRRGWMAGPLLVMALLGGCVTGGGDPGSGGYPGSAGYPDGSYPGDNRYPGGYGSQRLQGTVQYIDAQNGRIVLDADAGGYGNRSQAELYFDRDTQLLYQGRSQSVRGLERGDRISVDAVQSNGRLWARGIELIQNVRDGSGSGSGYGGQFNGAVSHVDQRARVISITSGGYSGGRQQVQYDERTLVEYRGQSFRPEQLDPGDVIRIQARRSGNGWLAERIWVEVDARSR